MTCNIGPWLESCGIGFTACTLTTWLSEWPMKYITQYTLFSGAFSLEMTNSKNHSHNHNDGYL